MSGVRVLQGALESKNTARNGSTPAKIAESAIDFGCSCFILAAFLLPVILMELKLSTWMKMSKV
ncbi:hypothetical protein CLI64_26435 [Nostoc sp. CENA543]|nr:hypothetical protein CLI64_26435 [Nostoc sp. CENA543]